MSDVKGLLAAVRDLAAVNDPSSFPPVALASVDRLIPTEISTYNEVDPTAGRVLWAARPESFAPSPAEVQAFNDHAADHPIIRYTNETGDGSARRISDLVSRETFHDTPLYRDFYGPLGVEYQMAVALAMPSPTIVAIALNRGAVDFSDRERRLLETLRPHLVQAWQQARDRARLARLLATATEVVRAQGTRVLLLGDDVDELTPGTAVVLYRFYGRPRRDHPLPSRVLSWVETERARLVGPEPPTLSRSLRSHRDGRTLTLRYLAATAGHPEALLMTEEATRPPHVGLQSFGLTPREIEVLKLAGAGATNAAIAQRLKIAPGTVKKHLDNVYAKLGVRSRIEALAYVRDGLAQVNLGP